MLLSAWQSDAYHTNPRYFGGNMFYNMLLMLKNVKYLNCYGAIIVVSFSVIGLFWG